MLRSAIKYVKKNVPPVLLAAIVALSAGCKEPTTPTAGSQHLIKAQSFLKNGQLSAARIEIMNALQATPSNAGAYFVLSEIYEQLGSFDESLKQINKGLSLSTQKPKDKQLKKFWLELMSTPEEGLNERISSFDAITNSEKAESAYLKAFLLLKNKKEDEAKIFLNQAIEIIPSHVDSLLFLARLSAKDQDINAANNFVSKALAANPNSEDALILKGQLALKQQDFALAEESFTFALLEINKSDVMTPKKYTILSGLVLALNKSGQQDKAIQYSDILARSRPGQLKSSYQGALTALSNRNIKKAEDELGKALRIAPSHAPSNYLMGMTKLRQGDLESAEEYLNTAIEGKYIPEKTRLALILTRLKLKRLDEAQLLIKAGLSEFPSSPTYLSLQGSVSALKDQTDSAETSFKAALEKDKGFLPALNGLASLYEKMGNIDASKAQLVTAAYAAPDNIQLLTQIIRFAIRNKQNEWALNEIKKLQKKNDTELSPALILAAYYYQLKDIRQSQQYLDKAEVINPKNRLVKGVSSNLHILKASLAIKQNDTKEALNQLSYAISAQPENLKAYVLKAGLLAKDGDTAGAIKVAKSLQKDERMGNTGLELEGNIWAEVAQFEKAAGYYDELWKTIKNDKLALKIYRIKKEFSDSGTAMAHVKSWVEDNPEELSALITLAMLEQENNNNKSAITLYEKALSIKSNNPLVLNNLSYIYFEGGDPRATELAAEAYKLAPKSAAIADTYGWILVETNQLSKGLPILQEAAMATPKAKEILQHYSEALTRAGKLEEAATVMEEITKL
ncbi:MAG: tetratricopeptide repeat protein [Pseudomonadales bacterium]|nr:tetratricopeptide repeat protein [Pseudomonadales bacterium]